MATALEVRIIYGTPFLNAAAQAVDLARRLEHGVTFEFNGVRLFVWPGDSTDEVEKKYKSRVDPAVEMRSWVTSMDAMASALEEVEDVLRPAASAAQDPKLWAVFDKWFERNWIALDAVKAYMDQRQRDRDAVAKMSELST